jgi:hypothetical protein
VPTWREEFSGTPGDPMPAHNEWTTPDGTFYPAGAGDHETIQVWSGASAAKSNGYPDGTPTATYVWTFDTGYPFHTEVKSAHYRNHATAQHPFVALRIPTDVADPLSFFVLRLLLAPAAGKDPAICRVTGSLVVDGVLSFNSTPVNPTVDFLGPGDYIETKARISNMVDLAPDGDPKVLLEGAMWIRGTDEPAYEDHASDDRVVRWECPWVGRPLVDSGIGIGHFFTGIPGSWYLYWDFLEAEGYSSQIGVKADALAGAAVAADLSAGPAVAAELVGSPAASADALAGAAVSADADSNPAVTGDVNMVRRHGR